MTKLNIPFMTRPASPLRTVLGMMFAPRLVGRLGLILAPWLLRTLTRGRFKTGPLHGSIAMALLQRLLRRR